MFRNENWKILSCNRSLFGGIFILLLWLVSSFPLTSQQRDSLRLTGVVLGQDDKAPLPSARLFLNRQRFGLADPEGRFSFWAREGDTIRYTYVGYKDLMIIINDSLLHHSYLMGIFLSRDTIAISEVVVVPREIRMRSLVEREPIGLTHEQQFAENNLRLSVYQGLQPNTKWEAQENQKFLIDQHTQAVQTRGQLGPHQTVSVNFIQIIPYTVKWKSGELQDPKPLPTAISREEIEYLKRLFDAIRLEGQQ